VPSGVCVLLSVTLFGICRHGRGRPAHDRRGTYMRVRPRELIVPGGGLRRHRAPAREAEPCVCAVSLEFV